MDVNLERYEDPAVVEHYGAQSGLFDVEAHLVERHIPPGGSLLDLGVGGGRTTAALSARAARYVGADYSAGMVAACRARFPQLTFVQADATRMPEFEDGSFDAVVFPFNAIDYILEDEARARCLREVARVLAEGGVFVTSSHNARLLAIRPLLEGASPARAAWRILRSAYVSARVARRNLASGVYRRGEGYVLDPIHGGLETYVSVPETFEPQLARAGLDVLETAGGLHPVKAPDWMQPWFYYACRKRVLA